MGLSKVNLRLCLLWAYAIITSLCYSQSNCEILAPSEPERVIATRVAGQIQQNPNILGHVEWDSLSDYRVSDDRYTSVKLQAADRSHQLVFSDFNYNIPEGSIITGIQVVIEGGSYGLGKMKDMQVQLLSGSPVGENKANYPIYGDAWEIIEDGMEDETWKFGFGYSLWQKEWSPSEINSSGFGVAIQVENEGWAEHVAYIDQVYIRVYYIPVYDLCLHDCTVFFIDEVDGVENYSWSVPPQFHHMVSETNQHIANLQFIDSIVGTYQICVTPQGHPQCCRTFVYNDCSKGSIGDLVWFDSNGNGLQDPGEPPLSDIQVHLYNESGIKIETTVTNGSGNYLFENLCAANYKVQVWADPIYQITTSNTSNTESNSDFDPAYGPYCSGVIHLGPGEDIRDIDFGFVSGGDVKGMVWKESNGDGSSDTETGIPDVMVKLFSCNGELVEETITDSEGKYCFEQITIGSYYIMANPIDIGSFYLEGDSDFSNANGEYTTDCFEVSPSNETNINLGYVPHLIVGDLIWEDQNKNGIQDPGEPGIPDLLVFIYTSEGEYVRSVYSNDDGNYWLIEITPGTYYVEIQEFEGWNLVSQNVGADDDIDSDAQLVNDVIRSDVFELFDCEDISSVDVGLCRPFATIEGTAWLDENCDNSISNENGIGGLNVMLFNCEGILVDSETTNPDGSYSFESVEQGDYVVYFQAQNGYVYSIGNDSSVSSQDGTTSCFAVSPNMVYTVNSGYCMPVGTIMGVAYLDEDCNGLNDNGTLLGGITVTLSDCNGNILGTQSTNNDGSYSFPGMPGGSYVVNFGIPTGHVISEGNDNDVNNGGTASCFELEGGLDSTVDAGFKPVSNIGDFVWNDLNKNGIQDPGEPGIPDVVIQVYDLQGNFIGGTATNQDGKYWITGIAPGDYYLLVTNFSDLVPSPIDQGTDETIDSDGILDNGDLVTEVFTISGTNDLTYFDFGFCEEVEEEDPIARITGNIWIDADGNTLLDANEMGAEDIPVVLFNCQGQEVENTLTNIDGNFAFEDLGPGSYYVLTIPTNEFATFAGGDSDVSNTNGPGSIDCITLNAGDETSIQVGLQPSGSIGDLVWNDTNENGTQDVGEGGISGILVSAYTSDGDFVGADVSNFQGNYNISNLAPGDYYLQIDDFGGWDPTQSNATANTTMDSDGMLVGASVFSPIISLSTGEVINDIDFGFSEIIINYELTGFVWLDEDGDGNLGDESGIENQEIAIYDCEGNVLDWGFSNAEGFLTFPMLTAGDYVFEAQPIGQYEYSFGDDSTFGADGFTECLTIADGVSLFLTFGVSDQENPIDTSTTVANRIAGSVWRDSDGNGMLNSELNMQGATVVLKDCDGNEVSSQISNFLGEFSFDNIPDGQYYLTFDNGERFDSMDGDDNDITGSIENLSTDCIEVSGSEANIIAGLMPLSRLGDFVWEDMNENGIQDSDEPGITGHNVGLFDEENNFMENAMTDAEGKYVFDFLAPGNYSIRLELPNGFTDITLSNQGEANSDSEGTFDGSMVQTTMINIFDGNDDMNRDFGFIRGEGGEEGQTAEIVGIFFRDTNGDGLIGDEPGIADQEIKLFDCSGTQIQAVLSTDEGRFRFTDIPSGQYYVVFPQTEGTIYLESGDSNITSENIDGSSPCFDYVSGTMEFIIGGLTPVSRVGNLIWNDLNGNGIQEEEEPGIPGLTVTMYNMEGEVYKTTVTNSAGTYNFIGVTPNTYYIVIKADEYEPTMANAGDDALDSDGFLEGGIIRSDLFTITNGINNFDIDYGLLESNNGNGGQTDGTAAIGDYVWLDVNNNGVQEFGEFGMQGIVVNLLDEMSQLIFTTSTDNNGAYRFEMLEAGDYYLHFIVPEGLAITGKTAGDDREKDNDADVTGITDIITLMDGEVRDDIDVGVFESAGSISGRVWIDENADGKQGEEEESKDNIQVILKDLDGMMLDDMVTNVNGMYAFVNLPQGMYSVEFVIPSGYSITDKQVDFNDSEDSDVNEDGHTDLIILLQNESERNVDLGLIMNSLVDLPDEVATEPSIIALTLVYFEGVNKLNWTDSNSKIGDTYRVYRKVDGEVMMTMINQMVMENGMGLEFNDTDSWQYDNYEYQLEKIDQHGDSYWSNVVKLDYALISPTTYPSPASETVNLDFTMLNDGDCKIKLFDMEGNFIKEMTFKNIKKGKTSLNIPLDFEQDGNFIIHAELGRQLYSDIITRIK